MHIQMINCGKKKKYIEMFLYSRKFFFGDGILCLAHNLKCHCSVFMNEAVNKLFGHEMEWYRCCEKKITH